MPSLSDAAWTLVVQAGGDMRGKVFVMRADTLRALLAQKRRTMPPARRIPRSRRGRYDAGVDLYGVAVVVDPLLRFGEIGLELW